MEKQRNGAVKKVLKTRLKMLGRGTCLVTKTLFWKTMRVGTTNH